ncbi:hypothetical protein AAFF_G00114140 [Aldrovandia affinis]|uniref:Uncharacterized protein n=1 Tax=Aldrovandia affinis TaxID=143900 RepID=A0AAD7RST9_9TELE|nr:hypothetical protein AAFF_G00114140 [Aldrovandia affinis]
MLSPLPPRDRWSPAVAVATESPVTVATKSLVVVAATVSLRKGVEQQSKASQAGERRPHRGPGAGVQNLDSWKNLWIQISFLAIQAFARYSGLGPACVDVSSWGAPWIAFKIDPRQRTASANLLSELRLLPDKTAHKLPLRLPGAKPSNLPGPLSQPLGQDSVAMDTESTYSGYSYYSGRSRGSHRHGSRLFLIRTVLVTVSSRWKNADRKGLTIEDSPPVASSLSAAVPFDSRIAATRQTGLPPPLLRRTVNGDLPSPQFRLTQ